ncbi:hypothetical protein Geu3261_0193_007 [Komagataeibacter europaeus NBRC 3261]|uniref:Transposase n=1 Tax=Komagataeibacter europaeus NBRC 3261 TaxID=1234669 RepID=A0A0D6Q2H5_KOMEU|nr:hypothetical protein [Komagataeibacter europaeus]GAN97503.1 hypothetical protein Geu3261_0193_007 [Komagataeibacter europaeus NBRC 3261]
MKAGSFRLRLGVVSIDGTKIDADASKYRSVRYDRIKSTGEQAAVGGDDPGEEIVSIRFATQDGDQRRRIKDDHTGRLLLS